MRPTRLRLQGFRSFDELDLELPDGCVAITGENGAGKSSLITALELALFGPEGRSLEPYATEGGSGEMVVELEFEHERNRYLVRRGFSARGRGKSTLDLEVTYDPETPTEPLTRETAAETQAEIERVVGLTRDTYRASAYLAQGEGAAFTDAQPKDRKRILADVLALGLWEQARERVGADRAKQAKLALEAETRAQLLAEQAADLTEYEIEAKTLALELGVLDEDLAGARDAGNEAADRVRAADAAEADRRAAVAELEAAEMSLTAHRKVDVEAQVARERGDGVRTEIASLAPLAAEAIDLGDRIQSLQQREYDREAALAERQRLAENASRAEADLLQQQSRVETLIDRVGAVDEQPTCEMCGQALHDEARERTREALLAELDGARIAATTAGDALHRAMAAVEALVVPPPVEGLEEVRARAAEIHDAPERLSAARATLHGYEEQVARADTEERRAELQLLEARAETAREALDAIEPGPDIDRLRDEARAAGNRIDDLVSQRDQLSSNQQWYQARYEQAREAADQLNSWRAKHERLVADVDQLQLLERAFGRDGVPAWIVEQQAIPAIEHEANRILAELGGPIQRVELRTERELKGGGTRDALDIVCVTDAGARDYATFSGGERTRVDLALRLALARLLATRRGADVRMLAIDEPDGLDENGMAALVGVLRDLTQQRVFDQAYLVSHTPALRDSFDRALVVTRNGGGSTVEAT